MVKVQTQAKVFETARYAMILDTGTCKIYKITNTAAPGELPNENLVLIGEYCFGDLSFESSPKQITESLEQIETARKIRILQNKSIANKAVIVIDTDHYKVERAYHGEDKESGELITDLSLSRAVSAYAII